MSLKRRYILAFVAALCIHLLLLAPLVLFRKQEDKLANEPKKTLSLSQFEAPKREAQPTPKPIQKPQKQPKPLVQKPVMNPRAIDTKQDINTTTAKQPKIEIPQPQKPEPKRTPTLVALNDAFKSIKPAEPKGPIKQLYGDEFDSMTNEQKEFIQNNLGSIGRITERHLVYPEAAGRLNMQGRSVVEFFLHPNGDISELKLLDSSGYRALDKNSIETIEVAYKDYPRPSQKTKIRIYVHYQLY